MYYLINSCGLDINSRDKKKSTLLHWAAFTGNSMSVDYITAWGMDVNLQDSRGLTPLHLAIRAVNENPSTRSIRILLRRGAIISLEDNRGRTAIDYIDKIFDTELRSTVRNMVKTRSRNCKDKLKHCTTQRKRSSKTMNLYIVLMTVSFITLHAIAFPFSTSVEFQWTKILIDATFATTVVFGFLSWVI
jgi:hypothetical protein